MWGRRNGRGAANWKMDEGMEWREPVWPRVKCWVSELAGFPGCRFEPQRLSLTFLQRFWFVGIAVCGFALESGLAGSA